MGDDIMGTEKGDGGLRPEDNDNPPPYETILEIPDWTKIPPPPAYYDPVVMGMSPDKGTECDPAYPPPAYAGEAAELGLPHLGYADFLPKCIFPGDALQAAKFYDMKTLMTVVNRWLAENGQFIVCRCESIERKVGSGGEVETETTIRHEGSNALAHYVRGIRLWLKQNTNGAPIQQLWYMNIVPQTTRRVVTACYTMAGPMMHIRSPMLHSPMMMCHPGLFPSFETLDKVIQKLNNKLQANPIPGRVLTIETIDTKYGEGFNFKQLDADECSWSATGGSTRLFLSILRIFFIRGPPEQGQIDIVDFPPLCTDAYTSPMSIPKFESLSDTVTRASHWIRQQHDKRITNIQTVTTKMASYFGKSEYNTKDMDYIKSGSSDSMFIKVIRVAYVQTSGAGNHGNPALTMRSFVPVRYGSKLSETTSQTVGRINQWLHCTGARVFGVDTLEYEFTPQGRYAIDTDRIVSKILAARGHYWISTIRLYIDGEFEEPPPEVFPPIPAYLQSDTDNSSCCTIL